MYQMENQENNFSPSNESNPKLNNQLDQKPNPMSNFNPDEIYPSLNNNFNGMGSITPDLLEANDLTVSEHSFFKNFLTFIFFSQFLASLILLYLIINIPRFLQNLSGSMGFVYKAFPILLYLPIPVALISSFYLYVLFKVRKRTRPAWVLALTSIAMSFLLVYLLLTAVSTVFSGLFDQIKNSISPDQLWTAQVCNGVTGLIFPIYIALSYKKFDQPRDRGRLSKVQKIILFVYSGLVIAVAVILPVLGYISLSEKPFIGYHTAEKYLGTKPIYFAYLPDNTMVESIQPLDPDQLDTNLAEGFKMNIGQPKGAPYEKSILVRESVKTPTDISDIEKAKLINNNGQAIYEFSVINTGQDVMKGELFFPKSLVGNRRNLVFQKNGIWVSVLIYEDTVITRDELLKIAESMTQ